MNKNNLKFPLNIQMFGDSPASTAEDNTTITGDFARPQSIDFVHQFNGGIKKLLEALGVTRITPMAVGSTIKFYKAVADVKSGKVAEGEIIPLSKITTVPAGTKELEFSKYRKRVTGEAVQKYGYDQAVAQGDRELQNRIQKRIRADFFENLAKGEGVAVASSTGLQGALAAAWGAVQTAFEDDGAHTIAFVNPLDVADYIGKQGITTQTVFGMTFLSGFTDVTVITNTNVERGEIFATAPDNLNLAYADLNGEMAKLFQITTDETGYVGITHAQVANAFSIDTVAFDGMVLFAERLDGVFKIDIIDDAEGLAEGYSLPAGEELEDLTVAQLKALADLLGVDYPSSITKGDLIALLRGDAEENE